MDDSKSLLIAHGLASVAKVMRAPSGGLTHPFLVPGGMYADELWDWDSYWVTVGLIGLARHADAEFRQRLAVHAMGSWQNFFAHQASNGVIPIMVKADGSDPFRCAEGDGSRNQAKPIFGRMALAISEFVGDCRWLEPRFDQLLRFYRRWETVYRAPCGLLVWGSDLAIGIDNDPATYGRPEFSSANVLLNSLYLADLNASAQLASSLGRGDAAQALRARATELTTALRRECWDPRDRFFYSVDVHCVDQRDRYIPAHFPKGMAMSWQTLPLKIRGFAGFFPLWAGAASPEEADAVIRTHLAADDEFFAPQGIRSLAKSERMYAPGVQSNNPSNMLGPVWILANHVVSVALRRYGETALAGELEARTIALLAQDLRWTGTWHECYHPDTGAPNANSDFFSWNSLAVLMAGTA